MTGSRRAHVTVDELKVWRAQCHEKPCTWTYANSVKTDVYEQARRHRGYHQHVEEMAERIAETETRS